MRFLFELPRLPKIGKLVKLFVISDLFLLAGWGLVQPIFAIFITTSIAGATVVTVGIVASIYWIIKGICQIPIALLIDRISGEKDNFIVLVFGLILTGLSAFTYSFIDQIWQLYLVQAVHAVGMSMYAPAWSSIFSNHLDKKHEALDWSLDKSGFALAAGFTALLSGYIVAWLGFSFIFVITGILSLVAAFVIFLTPKLVFSSKLTKVLNDNKNNQSKIIRNSY